VFQVVIFSSAPPNRIARIMSRISRDAPEAHVCGVVFEKRAGKKLKQRMANWRKKMARFVYWQYVGHRILNLLSRQAFRALDMAIRFAHAAPRNPNGDRDYGLDYLREICKQMGAEILVTADIHSDQSVEFVRRLEPDLGLVYGTRILKPALYNIPRNGSINIHKRKVPKYRGGGAIGLWELLDDEPEIGITVHRVEAKVDVGGVIRSAVIPIDAFDDLESLALKADVVAGDLIVAAIRDFSAGTAVETQQSGPSKVFRNPAVEDFLQMKKLLASRRRKYGHPYRRPLWKLLIKSVMFALPVAVRNWTHRLKKDFPVVILYHHLVSDRPQRMAIPTAYFRRQVNYLLRHYRVVRLSEAVELLRKGKVTVPTVAVSFDDGYADNFINLRAVTEDTGIPVAYFISSEHITRGHEFHHDERVNERGFAPNTWAQVEVLKRHGYEIGSHTRNHADCGSTDAEFLRVEIVGSKEDIEKRLGPIDSFSFPFGKPANISGVAAEIACSTYDKVFSAYGGRNFQWEGARILKRMGCPLTLWELELQLQGVLEASAKDEAHLERRGQVGNSFGTDPQRQV
jgi:folate-dependent phosphoribosylglycinamide formyltransferase PurN/peptidoglycan/xylan/chitin deacetylase (PgdA/CDA1 family)